MSAPDERYCTDVVELRRGRWQDALADVECDALIVDAPYSEKTHASHSPRTSVLTACERDAKWAAKGGKRSTINYPPWTAVDIELFVAYWAPRTRGWFCSLTDDVLAPTWQRALAGQGRYVFAPVPFIETGSRVRLTGDGPSSWTSWLIVARPPSLRKWGTLQGAYIGPNERKPVIGGKSLTLMGHVVRDYSRPGDLVCDPCAGGGTTLLAAAIEGRRAIGAEPLETHYRVARKRLARGYTPVLFHAGPAPEQLPLFGVG